MNCKRVFLVKSESSFEDMIEDRKKFYEKEFYGESF